MKLPADVFVSAKGPATNRETLQGGLQGPHHAEVLHDDGGSRLPMFSAIQAADRLAHWWIVGLGYISARFNRPPPSGARLADVKLARSCQKLATWADAS